MRRRTPARPITAAAWLVAAAAALLGIVPNSSTLAATGDKQPAATVQKPALPANA